MRHAALVAVCLSMTLACEASKQKRSHRSEIVPAHAAPAAPSLFTREGISSVLSAVRARLGERPNLLMLELLTDRARMQVEDATRPGQLVEYEFRGGKLSDPIPVELSGKGSLAQNLFSLAAVDLSTVPILADAAVLRVDAERGRASRILLRRNLPQDDSIGFRVYVESPLRSSQVDADARGRLLEAGRYP